jgi:hypothetical protein
MDLVNSHSDTPEELYTTMETSNLGGEKYGLSQLTNGYGREKSSMLYIQ